MLPALFIAYVRAERLCLAVRPVWKAWRRWESEAASQIFQREIDPITGRPVPPCRGLGDCGDRGDKE